MSWDMVPGKNGEGYPDPTAATAFANISDKLGERFQHHVQQAMK